MKYLLHKLNKEAFLAIIAYLALFTFVSYLIITKKYLQFVVPRLVPFLIFMLILLLIFSLDAFKNLLHQKYKYDCKKYIPVLFLFLLLLFLNNQDLRILQKPLSSTPYIALAQSNEITTKNDSYNKIAEDEAKKTILAAMEVKNTPTTNNISPAPSNFKNKTSENSNNNFTTEKPEEIIVKTEQSKNTTPIILNNNNFYSKLITITNKIDEYEGQTLILEGFIVRDKNLFSNGDFYLARMAMTCCIADIMPFGLACFTPEGNNYPDGTWLHVEGKIVKTSFLNMPQAGLKIEKIKTIEPIDGYIYP